MQSLLSVNSRTGQLQCLDVSVNRPLGKTTLEELKTFQFLLLVKFKRFKGNITCVSIFEGDLEDNNGAQRMTFHGKIWISIILSLEGVELQM